MLRLLMAVEPGDNSLVFSILFIPIKYGIKLSTYIPDCSCQIGWYIQKLLAYVPVHVHLVG